MSRPSRFFVICGSVLSIAVLVACFFLTRMFLSGLSGQVSGGLVRFFSSRKEAPAPRPEDTIVIPEGWTLRDIGAYLEKQGIAKSADFLKVSGQPLTDYRQEKSGVRPYDFSARYQFLSDKPAYYGLEGYLFPDTYRIYSSSTPEDIISRMLDNFNGKLTAKMRADIAAQGKTVYETVTLASIVEKEAPLSYASGDNRDARIIAGIFLNRLRNGQPLQSDATLSYIFADNKPAHSGDELAVESPYNTYKHRGLPPGPICNPGLLALEAAIYPLATDYNYFLTTSDGWVVYAKTYEDHLRNKQKYLR